MGGQAWALRTGNHSAGRNGGTVGSFAGDNPIEREALRLGRPSSSS
jgi:hypothetical protein